MAATKRTRAKAPRLAGSPAAPAEQEPNGVRGKMAPAPHKASAELEAAYAVMAEAAEAFLASSGAARYAAAKGLQTSVGAFYRFDKARRAEGAAA